MLMLILLFGVLVTFLIAETKFHPKLKEEKFISAQCVDASVYRQLTPSQGSSLLGHCRRETVQGRAGRRYQVNGEAAAALLSPLSYSGQNFWVVPPKPRVCHHATHIQNYSNPIYSYYTLSPYSYTLSIYSHKLGPTTSDNPHLEAHEALGRHQDPSYNICY